MRIPVEIKADISRRGLFQALDILRDAASRLVTRMTETQLFRLEEFGAALIAAANDGRKSRRESSRCVAQNNTISIETFCADPRKIKFADGDGCGDRGGRAGVTAQ